MVLDSVTSQLWPDLVDEVFDADGRPAVVTTFTYPNGDSVNLYFSGEIDALSVTDGGATLDFFNDHRIEITEDRTAIIRSICLKHGMEFNGVRFSMRINPASPGADCMKFCEAITRVSSIYYHRESHQRSNLRAALQEVLRRRVKPIRNVIPKWTAPPEIDPKELYPVDHRMNGEADDPRHIFDVTSVGKAMFVPAVVYFLRTHHLDAPTMTIVDERVKLGKDQLVRLRLVSNVRVGLEGNEDAIVQFALSR